MRKMILLTIAIFLFGVYTMLQIFRQPETSVQKTVDIPIHSSLRAISTQLENEGVLQHPWSLMLVGRISGAANKVQYGEFMFRVPSSPKNILDILLHGSVVLHKVTIPEGSTVADMVPLFTNANISSSVKILEASRDKGLLKAFGIPSDRFEGYLFPETYLFSKHEPPKRIFQAMNDLLQKNITAEDRTKAEALGWNLHQWLTFASVIEKETGNANEYPLVSSVFHNRLKKGMKLQSDPTVIYGIENYDGNIRKVDLQTDTPYNTYTRKGLPIGPVCNPGAGAIHAAVNPGQTDYLYFVGNGAGVHIFTKTYEEHLKAVQKYQLKISTP